MRIDRVLKQSQVVNHKLVALQVDLTDHLDALREMITDYYADKMRKSFKAKWGVLYSSRYLETVHAICE